jgi:competence protein ComEA
MQGNIQLCKERSEFVDLFGKKRGWFALSAASACLVGYVIWQFALGGRSTIQNEFLPVNDQMQQIIAETAEQTERPSNKAQEHEPKIVKADSGTSTTPSIPSATPFATSSVKGPSRPSIQPKPSSSISELTSGQRIDLNTSTLEQLNLLPGIGASKAKAIIDYREKNGRFEQIEQLMEVKGIGEKVLEKLKPLVYVTQP